jgi:hypothetical protein
MALNRRADSRSPNAGEGENEKVSGEPERVAPQRDEVGERRQHEEFMRKWKEAKPDSEQ